MSSIIIPSPKEERTSTALIASHSSLNEGVPAIWVEGLLDEAVYRQVNPHRNVIRAGTRDDVLSVIDETSFGIIDRDFWPHLNQYCSASTGDCLLCGNVCDKRLLSDSHLIRTTACDLEAEILAQFGLDQIAFELLAVDTEDKKKVAATRKAVRNAERAAKRLGAIRFAYFRDPHSAHHTLNFKTFRDAHAWRFRDGDRFHTNEAWLHLRDKAHCRRTRHCPWAVMPDWETALREANGKFNGKDFFYFLSDCLLRDRFSPGANPGIALKTDAFTRFPESECPYSKALNAAFRSVTDALQRAAPMLGSELRADTTWALRPLIASI